MAKFVILTRSLFSRLPEISFKTDSNKVSQTDCDNGQCRLNVRDGYEEPQLERFRILSTDGKTITVLEEGVKHTFYGDCDDETVAWVIERLCPQPTIIPKTWVSTTPERWGRFPCAYIQCTEDTAIPLKNQEYFCRVHLCDPVIKMSTSHSPFMSEPEALANHLHALR